MCRSKVELATWPEPRGATRVLVESSNGAERWAYESQLRRVGFDVAVCGGPPDLPRERCPLVSTGHCALAEGADVVFSSLNWSDPRCREVLLALRRQKPGSRLVMEITKPRADTARDLLGDCQVLYTPVTSSALDAAMGQALGAATSSS